MSMTIGEMTQRLHDQGKDPTGLGWWVWQLFRGKNGVRTRIYTCYRPCTSRAEGLSTVYTQQRTYFRDQRREPDAKPREPREAFIEDLEKDAMARQMAGERIVIMMDANGDVTRGQLKGMEMNLGLKNTILTHNKSRDPPATHKRGSQMIDVILSSPEIVITGAAMLGGKDSLGDHRTLIVDFEEDSLIGENLLKIVRPEARRLVCGQPEVRRRYITALTTHLRRHKVLEKLLSVQAERFANQALSSDLAARMSQIDKVKTELMRAAEKKCRKLKMGAVDFSPAMAAAGDLVRLRGLVKRRRMGHRIAPRTIQRLAKKLKVEKPLSCTLEEAVVLHKEAMDAYYILKPNAPVLRREFLIAKLDDETQTEDNRKAVHQLLNNEKAREVSCKLKRIKNLPHLGAIS